MFKKKGGGPLLNLRCFQQGKGHCHCSQSCSLPANFFDQLEDVNFVVNVGDSFYPDGVSSKDDLQWDLKWRQVYSTKVTQLQRC